MKIPILFIKFLFVSALFIVSTQNLHMGDSAERGVFVEQYSSWLRGVFDNFKSITGYVLNSEWLPSMNHNLSYPPQNSINVSEGKLAPGISFR